jgi:hypothetical protein
MSTVGEDLVDPLVPDSLTKGGNFFENLGNDVMNYGVQALTLGTLGYQDGKVSNGVTTNYWREVGRASRKGIKDVTGATAAEEANRLAREQFEQQRADAEAARLESIRQTGRDQMRQSNLAGAVRNTARSTANRGQAVGSYSLGDEEKDVLGV